MVNGVAKVTLLRLSENKTILTTSMEIFFTALGWVLIIEGLLPFLSPKGWRGVFEQVLKLTDGQIRFFGLGSIVVGLLLMLLLE